MKRIGLYIRVSTEEQARVQDGSLVSQRKRLEEYVQGQNRRDPDWGLITDVYVDEGRSAKDMNRSEFQRLLSDVRLGKVNLILSTELSRCRARFVTFVKFGICLKSTAPILSLCVNSLTQRQRLVR